MRPIQNEAVLAMIVVSGPVAEICRRRQPNPLPMIFPDRLPGPFYARIEHVVGSVARNRIREALPRPVRRTPHVVVADLDALGIIQKEARVEVRPGQRESNRERAWKIWNRGRLAAPIDKPSVLIQPQQGLQLDILERLLQERDDRRMMLAE